MKLTLPLREVYRSVTDGWATIQLGLEHRLPERIVCCLLRVSWPLYPSEKAEREDASSYRQLKGPISSIGSHL